MTFKNDLVSLIYKDNRGFSEVWEYLMNLKSTGMKKSEMLSLLEELRLECVEEEDENFILDMMDCAYGWCHPDSSIYS